MVKIVRLALLATVILAIIVVSILETNVKGTTPSRKISPPTFIVRALEFTLSDGKIININANVKNTGEAEGIYTAKLTVDSESIATNTAVIAADNIETISFSCHINISNGNVIEIDGLSVPIKYLAALEFTDPQVIIVSSSQSFVDILHPLQVIHLPPFKLNEASREEVIITHNYTWLFDGTKWIWELQLPESLYCYFKGLPRLHTNNYSAYVNNPMDDRYFDKLVLEIERVTQEQGYNRNKTAQFAVAFVQGLAYTSDYITTDYDNYPRYPIETLVDFGGDCEDKAILVASLLNSMNQELVLIAFSDHYAIGILGEEGTYGSYWEYDDERYFYMEMTTMGWKIGEIPENYVDTTAVIYPLD